MFSSGASERVRNLQYFGDFLLTNELAGADFVSVFDALEAGPLLKLGTQYIQQVIRTSWGLHRPCDADVRVGNMFDDVLVEQNCSFP